MKKKLICFLTLDILLLATRSNVFLPEYFSLRNIFQLEILHFEILKVFLQNAKFSHFFAKRFVRWKMEIQLATNSNIHALLYLKPDGKTFEISNFNSLILQNSNRNIIRLQRQRYSTM